MWSRQIIKAVSEVHSKGFVVGVIELNSVGLRADGTAVLSRLQTSQRHLQNVQGQMPPELRNVTKSDEATPYKIMNFRTDVFQLGHVLWLLAEHRQSMAGYLCAKSVCTSFPRYMCSVDHVNPVELPACCGGVPLYFSDIIRDCRLPNPRARPTARKLAEVMPYTSEHPPGIIELVDTYAPSVDYFMVHCDECGMMTRNLHYHCNVCWQGDFDICPMCFAHGAHCFVPEH